MPKKGNKGKKRTDQYTPREDEVNNDIKVVSEEKKDEAEPTEAIVPAEVVQVETKVQDAPVVEDKQDEPKPVEEKPAEENKIEEVKAPEDAPKQEIIEQKPVAVEEPVAVAQEPEAPNGESSGFVVVDKKEDQTQKTEEVQIKPDHVVKAVKTVGIKSMKRDIHPEINSPFRRKKTDGGLKLSLLQEPDSPITENAKEEEKDDRFEQIKPQWDKVLGYLAMNKLQFEDLKQATQEEHIKMYRDGEFKTLVKDRQAQLELQMPQGSNVDPQILAEFHTHSKETHDEISDFIHILQDWVDQKTHYLEESVPADQLKKTIVMEEVQDDFDVVDDSHILEAERMGIPSKNPDELKGLVREASIRVEKGEPAIVKKQTTKKSDSKKNTEEKEEDKQEEEPESGILTKVVIGVALLAIAGGLAMKYLKK